MMLFGTVTLIQIPGTIWQVSIWGQSPQSTHWPIHWYGVWGRHISEFPTASPSSGTVSPEGTIVLTKQKTRHPKAKACYTPRKPTVSKVDKTKSRLRLPQAHGFPLAKRKSQQVGGALRWAFSLFPLRAAWAEHLVRSSYSRGNCIQKSLALSGEWAEWIRWRFCGEFSYPHGPGRDELPSQVATCSGRGKEWER